MVKEGTAAPAFETTDANGEPVNLKDFRGKKVVLYFYPKDDTPGCTKEACSFRDGFSKFKKRGITILGVSPDSEKSHQKFTAKYKLPFTLLADTEHSISDAYGVYGEKKFMGRTYLGIKRMTFLIDEKGKIKKVFEKVKLEEHAREVLEAFRAEDSRTGSRFSIPAGSHAATGVRLPPNHRPFPRPLPLVSCPA